MSVSSHAPQGISIFTISSATIVCKSEKEGFFESVAYSNLWLTSIFKK